MFHSIDRCHILDSHFLEVVSQNERSVTFAPQFLMDRRREARMSSVAANHIWPLLGLPGQRLPCSSSHSGLTTVCDFATLLIVVQLSIVASPTHSH